MSRHATINKDEIIRYLERKNLTIKELPDKVLICECPLCPKPTYGKPDNMWKLCVFYTGGFLCLRCGEKGSFYEFKRRLGDLPVITGINGAQKNEAEPQMLSQTDAQSWVDDLKNFPSILTYLTETRGLKPEILKKYCVGAKKHRFPGASMEEEWVDHDCMVFPWTTTRTINGSDVVYTRAKVRSLQDKSCMRLLPRGGEWGLFGWHTVPHDAEEVIITEGEFDAMAVHQATGLPAISLPNGCRSLPPQLLPCLEKFKRIILWMDDDTAGHEGAENMVHKLGLQRCLIVPGDYGAKDANEALLKGLDIALILAKAQVYAHKQIAAFGSFRADVKRMFTEPNAHVGVPYANMPHLQSLMKGHRRGEVTIITGSTGVGKTTILSQLSLETAQQGVPTLWGSFEIRNPRLARTMMKQYSALLGIELNEHHHEAFDYVADRFEELPFYFLKFYGSSPVQEVIEAMEYAVYVHDVQHIILDNLQFMLSGQGRASADKFELQDRAIEAFRQFASQRNVHVSLVIHPRKEADNSSLGLASVFGSAKATQEADNVLIIQAGLPRSLTKPLGLEKGGRSKGQDLSQGGGFEDPITGEIMATFFRTLELRKNRWDGDLGAIPLRFEKSSGRLYELTKEDVQSGLTEFVEKHRKLKQLDLIRHMSQHNTGKSGFESHQVQKGAQFIQSQPQTPVQAAPQQGSAKPAAPPQYHIKQQVMYASKPPPQSAPLPRVAGQAIPLPPPIVGAASGAAGTSPSVAELTDEVIESVLSTGVDPR